MDIKPNGDVYCCNWTTAPFGNLQINTSQEVWHSENAQKIRESVINKTYEYCKCDECPWLAAQDEKGNPFVDEVPEVGDAPDIVNAAYDLTCNLFCNSCRKFLIADQNYQRHDVLRKRIEELGHIKELILIGGGDPFSSPHTRGWMNEGISLADKITIWTNGILLTKERWKKINPQTRSLIKSIEVSIDAATPDTYHFVRNGSDWDILMENLQFISELRSSGEIDNFRINFVVRRENYLEMPEFVKLGKSFGVDDIYFSRLEDWGSFSCHLVPPMQVHLNNHPKHNDFLRILESPELQDPIVRLGNLKGRSADASC
jgi:MoaA/NifB/PqqE/SkfB family radical SAM enzyme